MTNPTMKLVPRVPTEEMRHAARDNWVEQERRLRQQGFAGGFRLDMLDEIYGAFLAASRHAGQVSREQRDAVATAICGEIHWRNISKEIKDVYRTQADDGLAALGLQVEEE